jgi:acyl-CoA synthetase (AMP-forming)/AMP-acid ligase II
MHTVFDFAAKRAELAPDAVAFEEADGRRRVTFAEFNDRAERGAAALERMGVAAGERVAILCHNSTTFFEVLFACGKAGAILVPLNWRQTPAELARSWPTAARACCCTMWPRRSWQRRWENRPICVCSRLSITTVCCRAFPHP